MGQPCEGDDPVSLSIFPLHLRFHSVSAEARRKRTGLDWSGLWSGVTELLAAQYHKDKGVSSGIDKSMLTQVALRIWK